jgi:hypothetical protein
LFIYNAFCVISDQSQTKAGTITANQDRFMEWKTVDGSYEETQFADFTTLINGMFTKTRFLDILHNFICFSKQFALAAARKLQRDSLKFSWCEVSGKAESFLVNQCGAMNYLIDPNIIKQIYPNIYVDIEDNTHYTRILTDSGISVRKIAFGTING